MISENFLHPLNLLLCRSVPDDIFINSDHCQSALHCDWHQSRNVDRRIGKGYQEDLFFIHHSTRAGFRAHLIRQVGQFPGCLTAVTEMVHTIRLRQILVSFWPLWITNITLYFHFCTTIQYFFPSDSFVKSSLIKRGS